MTKKVVVIARGPNSNWARIVFGTLVSHDVPAKTATLRDARQCLYYSRETGGEAGLAAIGPQAGSRVSPTMHGEAFLDGVGMVADASPRAVEAWESFK